MTSSCRRSVAGNSDKSSHLGLVFHVMCGYIVCGDGPGRIVEVQMETMEAEQGKMGRGRAESVGKGEKGSSGDITVEEESGARAPSEVSKKIHEESVKEVIWPRT